MPLGGEPAGRRAGREPYREGAPTGRTRVRRPAGIFAHPTSSPRPSSPPSARAASPPASSSRSWACPPTSRPPTAPRARTTTAAATAPLHPAHPRHRVRRDPRPGPCFRRRGARREARRRAEGAGTQGHRRAGRLRGRPLSEVGRRATARRIATVEQHAHTQTELTVRDVVALGRVPHRRAWTPPTAADADAVSAALARTGLTDRAAQPGTPSPAANASAPRSPAPSPRNPASSCSTSPPTTSTSSTNSTCWTSSPVSRSPP